MTSLLVFIIALPASILVPALPDNGTDAMPVRWSLCVARSDKGVAPLVAFWSQAITRPLPMSPSLVDGEKRRCFGDGDTPFATLETAPFLTAAELSIGLEEEEEEERGESSLSLLYSSPSSGLVNLSLFLVKWPEVSEGRGEVNLLLRVGLPPRPDLESLFLQLVCVLLFSRRAFSRAR